MGGEGKRDGLGERDGRWREGGDGRRWETEWYELGTGRVEWEWEDMGWARVGWNGMRWAEMG